MINRSSHRVPFRPADATLDRTGRVLTAPAGWLDAILDALCAFLARPVNYEAQVDRDRAELRTLDAWHALGDREDRTRS